MIVVDDGSRDGTRRVIFDYIRRHGLDAVRLLQQPANLGKVSGILHVILECISDIRNLLMCIRLLQLGRWAVDVGPSSAINAKVVPGQPSHHFNQPSVCRAQR